MCAKNPALPHCLPLEISPHRRVFTSHLFPRGVWIYCTLHFPPLPFFTYERCHQLWLLLTHAVSLWKWKGTRSSRYFTSIGQKLPQCSDCVRTRCGNAVSLPCLQCKWRLLRYGILCSIHGRPELPRERGTTRGQESTAFTYAVMVWWCMCA